MIAAELAATGLVFRGAEDVNHLRNAVFPSIAQLADGTLVSTMTVGREKNSADVRCYATMSVDGGGTWSAPAKIFEPAAGRHPVSAGIRMSQARDGSLIGYVNLLDRSDPDAPTTNRRTGGTVPREHAIIRSSDGRSWSDLGMFEFPLDWKCFGEPSPVIAVDESRWLLPSLTRLDWEGRCPLGLKSFALISDDQGKTWPRSVDVFDMWSAKVITWEQKHVQLSDGRLMAVTWAFDSANKTDRPNHYTFSSDRGDSFATPPYESPLSGQTCTPLALEDNHILCVYRRLDEPGLWAHLARIEGTNWIPLSHECLWGRDRAALPEVADSSIQNQHNLQFGYPQLVQLLDGHIFAVFWAVEDGLSVIRWCRLQLSG